MPNPGELLGGRYRLDDRIAAGGMGEVWAATDTVLNRSVAVKTLLGGRGTDPGFLSRFRHEARTMAALRHPGVVAVYDFGDTDDGAYLVMARVDGQPLNRIIADRGQLTVAETMSIVAQAGRALQAAHEAGIVHRDVKPGNLIIEPDGTVVLVDFGVARSANSVTLTGAREVVGTALYIAPEQVSKQTTGPAADIYALGALAYHCLTGQPPFLGDNPLAVALQHVTDDPPPLPRELPHQVRDLVGIALAKDPADRFPSASVMATAAEEAANLDDDAEAAAIAAVDPRAVTQAVAAGAAAGFAGRAMVGAPLFADILPAGPAQDGHTMVSGKLDGPAGPASTTGTTPIPAAGSDTTGTASTPSAQNGYTGNKINGLTGASSPAGTDGRAGAGDLGGQDGTGGPDGAGPAALTAPRNRTLITIAAGLLLLLGLGTAFALADPFGLFDENPAGTAPGVSTPAPTASAGPKPATTTDKKSGGSETGRPRTSSPSRAATSPSAGPASPTGPAQPAETGSTAPETTAPATQPTTAAPAPSSGGEDNSNDGDEDDPGKIINEN
ncbi:serine/threonine-protein kinase [Actinoplanes palleronii]|uniref:non-specific serine/threonine protein kinase n=1 Tax=Actinoplanes palleronii TaxID=113570 RepID=A0ABQ4BBA5_9ACTN|nr:hypothetical protein Apa02nite_040460 [Actinoplanes palleronii]